MQFDAVVANPPYMGSKYINRQLKEYVRTTFATSKSDLFAMFIERGFGWCKPTGFHSMVTMQSWMFLSSFEEMREQLLGSKTLSCMVHMGNGVMGIAFGTAATVFLNKHIDTYEGCFSYCTNNDVNYEGVPIQFPVQNERLKSAKPDDFNKIPGAPISYWSSLAALKAFSLSKVGDILDVVAGLTTGNTNKFLRYWHEVDYSKMLLIQPDPIEPQSDLCYIPYNKGGAFRKWFGNAEYVLKYSKLAFDEMQTQEGFRGDGLGYFFRQSVTWAKISSGRYSARFSSGGFGFDATSTSAFGREDDLRFVICALNSIVGDYLLN